MLKECPVCQGRGFIEQLDGDGYHGEVVCYNCLTLGMVEEEEKKLDKKK